MKKLSLVFLTAIIVFGAILRLFALDKNPPGLYADELSIGYNAFSILKTGRDEHGILFPLSFKAFGEYKLPLYIYLTVPFIAIFGLNEWSVRLPSALSGVGSIVIMYMLARKLYWGETKDKDLFGLLASFLLAILPWHLQFSRGGFEATVALFICMLGLYLWLSGEAKRKILSMIIFTLTLYTYNSARVFTPLFVGILFAIDYYRCTSSRKALLQYFFAFILPLLFLIPNVLHGEAFIRSSQTSAFFESSRRFPLEFPILSHLFTFFANYFSYFSPSFLFFFGDGMGRHGIGEIGQLYWFELPLLVLAFTLFFQKKLTWQKTLVLGWLVIAPIAASLHRPSPHALRSLFMVVPLLLLSASGMIFLLMHIAKIRVSMIRISCMLFVIAMVVYHVLWYERIYWIVYPSVVAIDWQQAHKPLFVYLQSVEGQYNTITVTNWQYPAKNKKHQK